MGAARGAGDPRAFAPTRWRQRMRSARVAYALRRRWQAAARRRRRSPGLGVVAPPATPRVGRRRWMKEAYASPRVEAAHAVLRGPPRGWALACDGAGERLRPGHPGAVLERHRQRRRRLGARSRRPVREPGRPGVARGHAGRGGRHAHRAAGALHRRWLDPARRRRTAPGLQRRRRARGARALGLHLAPHLAGARGRVRGLGALRPQRRLRPREQLLRPLSGRSARPSPGGPPSAWRSASGSPPAATRR
jgi:hypothetical protein